MKVIIVNDLSKKFKIYHDKPSTMKDRRLGRKLVVIGDGQEQKRLKAMDCRKEKPLSLSVAKVMQSLRII